MALSERDMELVKLAATQAAFTAIKESDAALRMAMREEARPIAKAEAQIEARLSWMRLVIVGLLAGGGGGVVTNLPELVKMIQGFIH